MAMFSKPKNPVGASPLSGVNFNLPAMAGVNLSALPGIPQVQIPQQQSLIQAPVSDQKSSNMDLLKLLQAYQGS